MTALTPKRLAEIKARCEAMGPWLKRAGDAFPIILDIPDLLAALEEEEAETARLRDLLGQCLDYLFDDSGTPISPEDLRVAVKAALETPS